MKFIAFFAILITGFLLIYATVDMPDWGDPNSPPNSHVSPRFIEKVIQETATPNMVTAVLADYRGYDTFGETVVIFTAGIICLMLLRRGSDG
ncbi:MAG TPA: hydrogen gas-evolving membrane-bound hydrogenase subunit E [Dissulfurispiraceae bacterium]|nr:hydrogen gas-evolving membrane-bound hydrogenase subunit E [Dissulfurispiraceae bacterium]